MAIGEWQGIADLLAEMRRCEKANASIAAVAMAYVCIDTMAYLAMPAGQTSQTKQDFIEWANAYLKAHPTQPYQYAGLDVYAARCATLHAFGSEAELHRGNPSIKQFGYSDGGRHRYDPNVAPDVVIIGLASFLNDVALGVQAFLAACRSDASLRARVESRLEKLFNVLPYPRHSTEDSQL